MLLVDLFPISQELLSLPVALLILLLVSHAAQVVHVSELLFFVERKLTVYALGNKEFVLEVIIGKRNVSEKHLDQDLALHL